MAHLTHSREGGYNVLLNCLDPYIILDTSTKIQDGASSSGRLRVIFGSCSGHIRRKSEVIYVDEGFSSHLRDSVPLCITHAQR